MSAVDDIKEAVAREVKHEVIGNAIRFAALVVVLRVLYKGNR